MSVNFQMLPTCYQTVPTRYQWHSPFWLRVTCSRHLSRDRTKLTSIMICISVSASTSIYTSISTSTLNLEKFRTQTTAQHSIFLGNTASRNRHYIFFRKQLVKRSAWHFLQDLIHIKTSSLDLTACQRRPSNNRHSSVLRRQSSFCRVGSNVDSNKITYF